MTIGPLLYLVFGIAPGWPILLAPLGLAIVMLNGFWIGLLVGMLCARFRDLPQMIAADDQALVRVILIRRG
jgi:lipopolysaccharide transport system permease protein